jgi:hypothetical protein
MAPILKALLPLDGTALEDRYRRSLEALGVRPGMLAVIFKGARCEIHNPALLKQLIVNLLDKMDWLSLPVEVKGTIYEELLSRSAQESSRGAGQYFTTRPVIEATCGVMQPTLETRSAIPPRAPEAFSAPPINMCSIATSAPRPGARAIPRAAGAASITTSFEARQAQPRPVLDQGQEPDRH